MGRCYEFGAEIHAGCEQAMVVADEGGACVCRSCGSRCTGRFSGCAVVLSVPGRVPKAAPAWAVNGGAPAPEALVGRRRPANGAPAPAAPGSVADAAHPGADRAGTRPSGAAASRVRANGHLDPAEGGEIAALVELAEVQRALLQGVQQLADDQGEVVDALARLRADAGRRDDELAAAVVRLAERHDVLAGEVAHFGSQMDRVGVAIDRLASTLLRVEEHLESQGLASLRRRLKL